MNKKELFNNLKENMQKEFESSGTTYTIIIAARPPYKFQNHYTKTIGHADNYSDGMKIIKKLENKYGDILKENNFYVASYYTPKRYKNY